MYNYNRFEQISFQAIFRINKKSQNIKETKILRLILDSGLRSRLKLSREKHGSESLWDQSTEFKNTNGSLVDSG